MEAAVEALREQLRPVLRSLGDDTVDYVVSALAALHAEEAQAQEELSEFLRPYLEEAGVQAMEKVFQEVSQMLSPSSPQQTWEPLKGCLCYIPDFTLLHGGSMKALLKNATLDLRTGRCYGLVGANGKGKTTLMSKIAAGHLPFRWPVKCCYVQYEAILDGIDVTTSCDEYAQLRAGCSAAEVPGLENLMPQSSLAQLSGGWRMRVALACGLASGADLFLLDEPTNHLDAAGKTWLEECLAQAGGSKTIVFISHDFNFLERVCTDMIRITPAGKLEYDHRDSLRFWPLVREAALASASPTTHALLQPTLLQFPHPGCEGLPHVLASLSDCTFRYQDRIHTTLTDVNLQLTKRCRVGVVGPNGAGKSTLLSLLARELLPLSEGSEIPAAWHHEDLRLAYVAQQHFYHLSEHLPKTAVEYIQARFGEGWDEELRERLILPSDAAARRQDVAAKQGGRPYYFDIASQTWKGREVAAVLDKRIKDGVIQYLVRWKQTQAEVQAGTDLGDMCTWETARRLRQLGVEMLCVAFESKKLYARHRRSLAVEDIQRHLEAFDISKSMTGRPISTFSAGQMSKLVLAAAFWNRPHIVLLDEPTNFLDQTTVAALQNALQCFNGGFVVVSHNEEFLGKVCKDFWHVEDGHLRLLDQRGADKTALIKTKVLTERAASIERRAKEAQKEIARPVVDTRPEDVGHVISRDMVACDFHQYLGFSLSDDAIEFAVGTFVEVAEARRPSTGEAWLGAVLASVEVLSSSGFQELTDLLHLSAVFVSLVKSLLQKGAVGGTDRAAQLEATYVTQLQRMQYREKAACFGECCYCGRDLDPEDMDEHAKLCYMSPLRVGRRLGQTGEFEMFHGTSPENAASIEKEGFRPSLGGMLGPGVYCSRDLRKARRYGAVVLRVAVTLGRVITIDRPGHPLQRIWQTALGGSFDAAWVPPCCGVVASGLEENCVRSPLQIRVLGRVRL